MPCCCCNTGEDGSVRVENMDDAMSLPTSMLEDGKILVAMAVFSTVERHTVRGAACSLPVAALWSMRVAEERINMVMTAVTMTMRS